MKINYCPACGVKTNKGQNFCANCGANLRDYKGDFKSQLEKMIKDLLENNAEALMEMAEKMASEKGLFFSVELRDGKPIIKSGNIEEFEELIKDAPVPPFIKEMIMQKEGMEFKEAKVNVRETGGCKEFEVYMPEVKSIQDIEINKRKNTLEVTGKSNRIIYFAHVMLEDGDFVAGKEFRNGTLKIEVRNL
jgi:HSP20 family molecular chaperone IbpA